MDFSILYAIQNLHCDFLDRFILLLTKIAGSYGEIWLIVAAVLLIFKKIRKSGAAILLSYAIVFIVGQYVLKDMIARPRPCHIDQTIKLLIERPSSYSCPSTHSAWAFAAAASVWLNHRKGSIAVIIAAVLIAFSRLYLFVHFPTDVLFGIVLGAAAGVGSALLVNKCSKRIAEIIAKKRS